MQSSTKNEADGSAVRARLVASGGRLAQEFGFNRVAGGVLACLYLTPGEASLDALEQELGLSKAAVSLAAAQLERLGLIHRVRKAGDRKRYYQSADDIGSALRHGILAFARSKMAVLETDLGRAEEALAGLKKEEGTRFLASRVARMRELNRRAGRLLDNPLVKLFSKLG
jgi:DNA-binding transcriptional regulator GbsR (MarR family)